MPSPIPGVSSSSSVGMMNEGNTGNDYLPQAIAALLKSLLPGRAVRSAPANTQRVIRWRGKIRRHLPITGAGSVNADDVASLAQVELTSEDETILASIRLRVHQAQFEHHQHIKATQGLSLAEIHHQLQSLNDRAPRADQSLRACAWVWACAQWTKRRHLAPDAITMRLAPQLMMAPAFGTTRISEAKRGNMVGRVIEYVAPNTLPSASMRISDGHITSLVALESAPAMPVSSVPATPPTPCQIREALTRYQLVDHVAFLTKSLSQPLIAHANWMWQRRRWAILGRRATTVTTTSTLLNNGGDEITTATTVETRSLLAALPKDIFRLVTYLL